MYMRVLLLNCLLLLCQCSNEVFNPVDLFVIRDTVKEVPLSWQKARVKYAEMLCPQVGNDSLMMPMDVGDCPAIYTAYVRDFVKVVNAYLKEMPERLRYMVLGLIRANTIKKRVLESCVKIQGDKYVFTLSEKEAESLGFEKEYNELKRFLDENSPIPPRFLEFLKEPEPDTSIFCDFRLLNEELSPVFAELKQAFYALNRVYAVNESDIL